MNICLYFIMALKINSYNCTGLVSECNREYVRQLLINYEADFLLLQETWLSCETEFKIGNIHNDYMYTAVSGMDTRDRVIMGRPYGGVAIMWKRSLSHCVKPIISSNKRISCVILEVENVKLIIICVYLPCENWSTTTEDREYLDCLDHINQLIEMYDVQAILIGGDFNTDLTRKTAHTRYLCNFISTNGYISSWDHDNARPEPTYESYDGRSTSLIDNFLCTDNVFNYILSVNVIDNVHNRSNHKPICIELNLVKVTYIGYRQSSENNITCNWDKATAADLTNYAEFLSHLLQDINIDKETIYCSNNCCKCKNHISQIDNLCYSIIQCCIKASFSTIPQKRKNRRDLLCVVKKIKHSSKIISPTIDGASTHSEIANLFGNVSMIDIHVSIILTLIKYFAIEKDVVLDTKGLKW